MVRGDASRPAFAPIDAPVFPLPGVFLFPGQVLPLHIFEPRYRAMVEDSLDGPGRIAIAAIDPEAPEPPPLPALAGLGEIARHDKLDDGRFVIWLGGLARVAIAEVPSEKPYRRVRCTPVDDIPPKRDRASRVRQPLMDAINSRVDEAIELGMDLPIGLLTDLLTQCIPMPVELLGALFAESDVMRRAERALDAHRTFPKKPAP